MTRLIPSLFPQDLLIETGRVNRPPLRTWARSVLDRLESDEASPGNWLNVSGCLNNASLIEVYRGNLQGARELCELQLGCAENLIRFHDSTAYAEFVLQPWINLGRLLRIQHQFDRALDSFSAFLDAMLGKSPCVWPLGIPAPTWRKYAEAQDARAVLSFCKTVYIIDSMKTYFSAQDIPGAARFLQQARSLPGSDAHLLLDESELITLARLSRYEEALALTERPGWQREGYTRLVRVTYRLALLAAAGATDSAHQLGQQLTERILKMDWSEPKDQRLLRYLHYLGKLLHHVELHDHARSVWQVGLRGSHQFVDVPLQLSFLESLLGVDGVDRASLEAERSTLLTNCLYLPLLTPRGIDADPVALKDPLFEQLRGRLELVARASAPLHWQDTAA